VPDTFDGASASSAAALAGSKVSDTFEVASASSAGAVSPGAETASDAAAAGMTGSSGARRVPGTGVGPRPGASSSGVSPDVASDTSSAETSSGSGSARAAGSGWKGVGGWTRAGPAGGAHASRCAGRASISRDGEPATALGPDGAAHALGWACASAGALPRAGRPETMRSTSAFPVASSRTNRSVIPGRSPPALERTTTPSPRRIDVPSARIRSKSSDAPTGFGAFVARKNPSRPTWAP